MTGADIFRMMNLLDESDLVTKTQNGNETNYNYDWIGNGIGVTFVQKNED